MVDRSDSPSAPASLLGSRQLGGLALVVCAVFIAAAIWVAIKLFDALRFGDPQAIQSIGLTLVALVGAPFVVWRAIALDRQSRAAQQQSHAMLEQGRAMLEQSKAEHRQSEASFAQLERSRLRDYADLFSTAVEQLGAVYEVRQWDAQQMRETVTLRPNTAQRIGAIHTLARIARDSDRDQIAVLDTLCAYIREEAPATTTPVFGWSLMPYERFPVQDRSREDNWWQAYEMSARAWAAGLAKPRTDVQAALTAIGARRSSRIQVEAKHLNYSNVHSLDLRGTNLQGASFESGDFDLTRFDGAALDGADFCYATARAAYFDGASMVAASLGTGKLGPSSFKGARLDALNAQNADLYNSWFHNASMRRVRLGPAKRSDFYKADLTGAMLASAVLPNSSFFNAAAHGAVYGYADLRVTDLSTLSFDGADLTLARLDLANAEKADFRGATLKPEQLDCFFGGDETQLDPELESHRPKHWDHLAGRSTDELMEWAAQGLFSETVYDRWLADRGLDSKDHHGPYEMVSTMIGVMAEQENDEENEKAPGIM